MSKETTPYDRSLASGPLDRRLLRAAADGLSPKEMAAAIGDIMAPAEAAQYVRNLLESRDWLSVMEQEQLILESINDLINSMREWVDAGSVQHIKATLQALKMKQDQLARQKISPEEAANIVRAGQARIMLQAIQAAMMATVDELQRRFPQIPESEVRDIFVLELPKAVKTVEAHAEA